MSEYLAISCPKCGHGYKVPTERAGCKARCKCGHVWVLPRVAGSGAGGAEGAAGVSRVQAGPAAQPSGPVEAGPAPQAEPVKVEAAAAVAPAGPAAAAAGAEGARESAKSARDEEEARRLVGRELGNFRIEELLGVGGFGAVYRAFDKSLHRDIAIKVLPAGMWRAGKEKIQQFLLEARAAAKLSHPNIVTVHQICQSDGIYFIVMELVEGRSLADIVKMRRLSAQEATRIITEATRALAHAHKRGLIHRDVKPGNIIVTSEGHVKVTDFGLARDIFRDTQDEEFGRAVGTPLYMSPEQCEGEEGDSRSDVYSMGATYYVALTRRPPYEGRNTEEIMTRHRTSPPPDPRVVLPHLPPAVYRVIEKAMAKEPAERYQTAGELLTALEALDFAALDPRAGLDLQTVSAQISAVTPAVGEHVGAVIKEAVRRADTSRTGSRLLDSIEESSVGRWWLLVGGVAVLFCIAAVIVAVIMALRPRGELPPVQPQGTSQSTAPVGASRPRVRPPAEVGPAGAAKSPAVPTAQTPTTTGGQPGGAAEVQPAAVRPADQPADTAAQPEESEAKTEIPLEAAKATYEEAQDWEKKAWSTDPASVYDKYGYVIQYYPNTPYAQKAKEDIERLQKGAEQAPAVAPGDKPEETKPEAEEPQKAAPAKEQKPPAKAQSPAAKDQKSPAKDGQPPAKK